jgi:hypothetical protein
MIQLRRSVRFVPVAVAVVAGALGALAGTAKAVPAAPAASCTPKAYAYAGLVSNVAAMGIEATVTAVTAADVTSGHVAGWIGVGSPKAGPAKQPEWLQVGLNTQAGIGSELYAEITQPGHATRYLTLASGIAPGASYRLAVVELPGRPDVWHVLVNGKPATGLITLPGSKAFQPMAMGESWSGGAAHCNGFRYRFDRLEVTRNGSWQPLVSGSVLSDLGYKVVDRTKTGFTAISG